MEGGRVRMDWWTRYYRGWIDNGWTQTDINRRLNGHECSVKARSMVYWRLVSIIAAERTHRDFGLISSTERSVAFSELVVVRQVGVEIWTQRRGGNIGCAHCMPSLSAGQTYNTMWLLAPLVAVCVFQGSKKCVHFLCLYNLFYLCFCLFQIYLVRYGCGKVCLHDFLWLVSWSWRMNLAMTRLSGRE